MKVLAPLATAVAVVALVGGAALLSSGGSGTPKRLHLAGGVSRDSALGAPAASSVAGKIAGGGDYTLVGTLPAGTPDDAAAWTLPGGLADDAAVAALAKALGVATPAKNKDGWYAGGLQVSSTSGQSWYFSPCAVAYPVPPQDAPSTSVASCAISGGGVATDGGGTVSSGTVSSGSGSAPAAGVAPAPPTNSIPVPPPPSPAPVADQPCTTSGTTTANQPVCADLMPLPVSPPPYVEPPTPTSAEVFSAAGEVLSAVGLGEREGQVQTYPGGGTVTVNPQIDGLDTVGIATTVQVGASGKVESANGWLAPAAKGDSYPLVSAQKAFDALPSFPRMELCPVGPDGQGCTPPAPQEITGAHLGLMLAPLTGDALALLPAWLFDVKGTDQPVSGIAVQPSYLDTGTEATADPGDPGTKPGASTDPGTGTEPGTIEPAQPQEQIALTGARQSKADNAVTVLYENGGCGRDNVVADVKETATEVYVSLRADAVPKDQVCTANSLIAPYEVALQDPLGTRTVVDSSTGKPVPLS